MKKNTKRIVIPRCRCTQRDTWTLKKTNQKKHWKCVCVLVRHVAKQLEPKLPPPHPVPPYCRSNSAESCAMLDKSANERRVQAHAGPKWKLAMRGRPLASVSPSQVASLTKRRRKCVGCRHPPSADKQMSRRTRRVGWGGWKSWTLDRQTDGQEREKDSDTGAHPHAHQHGKDVQTCDKTR